MYVFNHPTALDPETASFVETRPESWVASILSQIDVDIHPGEDDSKEFTKGISSLAFESLEREDYATLRAAGVCGFEKDDGFALVSAIATDGTEIAQRRSSDFIILAYANFLKKFAKKKNVATRRAMIKSAADAFCGGLQRAERVVLDFENDNEKLNTPAARQAGIERLFTRVQLIPHMLFLVLETEIGTSVTIKEVA